MFEGKTALILGVANKRSIAWAIAKRLADGGATLAFTFQGERIEKNVRDLAETVQSPLVTELDVRSDDQIERVFREVGEAFDGKLDILVHSVAFAAAEDLEGRFTDTPRDRFWMAIDVSAYSLVACTRAAEPLFEQAGGGSVLTMTYLGGERAVPALQRDGRRQGDARLVGQVPGVGPRLEERAGERDLRRPGAHARGAVDRRLPDDGVDRRGALTAASPRRRRGCRRRGRLPALRRRPQRHRHDAVRRLRLPRDGYVNAGYVGERGAGSLDDSPLESTRVAYMNGLVTMSAITSSSTEMSTRAISRILLITASVSGCSGPFSAAVAWICFASGDSTAMPVMNVAA